MRTLNYAKGRSGNHSEAELSSRHVDFILGSSKLDFCCGVDRCKRFYFSEAETS